MQFKNDDIRRRWIGAHIHAKLGPLLADAEAIYKGLHAKEIVMTCAGRTAHETAALYAPNPPPALPSPHETDPLRAVDIRASILTEKENQEFADTMNKRWTYDVARPGKRCVLYHKVGANAWHLHLQVSNFTRRAPMDESKPPPVAA